ncbi:RidA family protein [Streptomyces sp. NPDC057474]|uniref:RidA family protein n=1 Tax=Streptomyces sp. NPDC057474 TaxID=3346144 RepID=UPI003674C39B
MPDYRVIPGPAHIHPFATAIASDDLIFISGLAALGETAADQAREVIVGIAKLLEDVDSSLSEIVYFRPTITDRAYEREVNDVIREMLPDPKPASGALAICQLAAPELKVEFEVIAQRGARLIPAE